MLVTVVSHATTGRVLRALEVPESRCLGAGKPQILTTASVAWRGFRNAALTAAPTDAGSLKKIMQGMLYGMEDRAVKAVDLFVDFDPLDPSALASEISLCVSSSTRRTSAFIVSGTLLEIHRSRKFLPRALMSDKLDRKVKFRLSFNVPWLHG